MKAIFAFAAVLYVSVPMAAETPPPIPSAEEQAKAMAIVKEVFGNEYAAAKTPAEKAAFARKMLGQAGKTNVPAEKYGLLRVGRDVAVLAGDAKLAMEIVEAVAKAFDVPDGLESEVAILEGVGDAAKLTAAQEKVLAAECLSRIGDTIATDAYDLAHRLVAVATAAAVRGRDKDLIAQAKAESEAVDRAAAAWKAAKDAEAKLAGAPGDPAANMAVGKYLCLVKGNWATGMGHLILCGDQAVVGAANLDVQVSAGGISDATQCLAAADAWWEVAESRTEEREKTGFRGRAGAWYRKAVATGIEGLSKWKAEKRIAECGDNKTIKVAETGGKSRRGTGREWWPGFPQLVGKEPAKFIFNLKAVPFAVVPLAKPAEKQQKGWTEVPEFLAKNYLHTVGVHYQGKIEFEVTSDGVIMAALTDGNWGDSDHSGGDWKKELQSREKLKELGWIEVEGVTLAGGSTKKALFYRDCKKGEKLYLRNKKYSTPLLIIPMRAMQ